MINREKLKSIKPIYHTYYSVQFLLFQLKLTVANLLDWRDRQKSSSIAIPPAKLRHRVHGSLYKESFIQAGKSVAQDLKNLCATIGRDIYSFESVLDFGCGCGRVLSNLQNIDTQCRFYGTDIDQELIKWCKSNLPNIQWSTNGFQPPLPFAENTFDLIYAISVFTHLNEELQNSWLAELQRVARPGAIIILSVHGDNMITQLAKSYQDQIYSKGFLYLTGATGALKLDKLPDFYQTTYHTKEYIRREWANYCEVISHIDRGIHNHHDAVLLRAR